MLFFPGCCLLLSSSFIVVAVCFPPHFSSISWVCFLPDITTWQTLFSVHKARSQFRRDANLSLIPSQNNTIYSPNNSGYNYLITSVYNIPFSALSCPGLAYISRALSWEYYSVASAMYCMMLHAFIRLSK